MADKPHHPDNPCRDSLPEAERVPAKMWELLRRNDTFKKAVVRLAQLDARAKTSLSRIQELLARGVEQGQPTAEARELEEECRRRSETKSRADGMLQKVDKAHPLAAAALQWLVPEPWFEVHHVVIAPDADLTQGRYVPLRVIKLESGSTPDPNDKEHWRVFEAHGGFDAVSAQSNAGCPVMVRGPRITRTVREDSRLLGSDGDPIREWRDYFSNGRTFSLTTPWREAPLGFRRDFCAFWCCYDSLSVNPHTQVRDFRGQCRGTNFFQGWHPFEIDKQLTSLHFQKCLEFDHLKNCHVFTVPKRFTNKVAFANIVEQFGLWLKAEIEKEGPTIIGTRRYQELLRGQAQWELFLYCWAKIYDPQHPVSRGAAFELYVQDIYAPNHDKTWQAAWESKSVQIERDFEDMNQLVRATYPRLDETLLLAPKP